MLNGYKTFIATIVSAISSALMLFGMQPQAEQIDGFHKDLLAAAHAWELTATAIFADAETSLPQVQEQLEAVLAEGNELVEIATQTGTRVKTKSWPMVLALIGSIGGFFFRVHTRIREGV